MRLPEKVVIHQPWGGLGDNLQFSTLPELFAAHGVKSFISTHNALRNPEIGQLVWDRNPFISGYSDEQPNAGSCVSFRHIHKSLEFIERIETAHGLTPTNSVPKLYYGPKQRPDLANAVLLDLGSISVQHRRKDLDQYLNFVIASYGYDRTSILQVRFERAVARGHSDHRFDNFGTFVPKDIFDYCDALTSCKAFITVHSGAQSMAVALRGKAANPAIHCYCTPDQFNGRIYIFPHVEYHVAGNKRMPVHEKLYRSIRKRVWKKSRNSEGRAAMTDTGLHAVLRGRCPDCGCPRVHESVSERGGRVACCTHCQSKFLISEAHPHSVTRYSRLRVRLSDLFQAVQRKRA